MEKEERHNEIVEEMVKMLAENDLYMKPEKYRWKMREVEFLRVGNRTRQDQNRGREDKGSIGLADSSRSQRYTKVLKPS